MTANDEDHVHCVGPLTAKAALPSDRSPRKIALRASKGILNLSRRGSGYGPVSDSSGVDGSRSAARFTGLAARTSAWIASLTSQTLTFIPASTRPP